MTVDIEMGVLGALYVKVGDNVTAPSAPKMRKVLATLIVHCEQVVPARALIQELWDDEPPSSGVTTLQTYILNLRKLLASLMGVTTAQVSKHVLITRAGGYAFQASVASLDVHRYREQVAEGRRRLLVRDDLGAVEHLTRALELWRGPALVDVPLGRLLESKARQFEESRLVAFEYLVEAQLRLGMYREAITELVGIAADNPLHEALHGQYMHALNGAGRRAEALDVFRQLRRNLVSELGLEPGPDVQRLQNEILNCDRPKPAERGNAHPAWNHSVGPPRASQQAKA